MSWRPIRSRCSNTGWPSASTPSAPSGRRSAGRTTQPDKIICHQVGATHQNTILEAIGVPRERDFTTFRYLGNIGTVSLPITAAIAEERGFLAAGDLVGFLGIGSGLNCLMLGVEW